MKKKAAYRAALLAAAALFFASPANAAELSIEEAVNLALAQNTSLHITEKGEDTARAELKSARGANSFTVTASGNYTDSKASGASHSAGASASVSASLPIYTGGKNEARIRSSEIGLDSARLATARSRENLRYNVIKAYYNVLQAKRTVEIDQESVDKYQAHLTNVEQLYRAGSKARLDVLRSSVELSNARQTLIKAQNDYEVEVIALKNLLRLDQREPLTLTDDFRYVPFDPPMESCVAYAFLNRKDLIIDSYTLKQKQLAVDMATAGYQPQVSLSASTGASHDFRPRTDNGQNYSAGIRVSWNIFDSGVTEAAVDQAKTALEVAELTLLKDKEDIDQAVRQAYYSMREAQKRLISTRTAVSEAEEDYYIATEKYRAGQGILLDIMDAQLALSTAKLNYISAQYDYARYQAALENASGLSIGDSHDIIDPEAAAKGAERRKNRVRTGRPPISRDYRRATAIVNNEDYVEPPPRPEAVVSNEAIQAANAAANAKAEENRGQRWDRAAELDQAVRGTEYPASENTENTEPVEPAAATEAAIESPDGNSQPQGNEVSE